MPSLEKLSFCLALKSHCDDTGMVEWMKENCAQVCQMEVKAVIGLKPKGMSCNASY